MSDTGGKKNGEWIKKRKKKNDTSLLLVTSKCKYTTTGQKIGNAARTERENMKTVCGSFQSLGVVSVGP